MVTKMWILGGLAMLAVTLGSGVLTLQVYVWQEKQIQRQRQTTAGIADGSAGTGQSGNHDVSSPNYYHATFYVNENESLLRSSINKQGWYADDGASSSRSVGKAYWNRVRSFLRSWDAVEGIRLDQDEEQVDAHANRDDPVFVPSLEDYVAHKDISSSVGYGGSSTMYSSTSSTSSTLAADPALFLKKAADAGHATAQHYLAMAYASGIWPTSTTPYTNDNKRQSLAPKLHVTDEFVDTASADRQHKTDKQADKREPMSQLIQAYLYWHMAAMGGNIEAAMALAHRIDMVHPLINDAGSDVGISNKDDQEACEASLPYYEAAAHGIIDQLEQSPNSRGRIIPPQDQHSLAEIHMHGGQSSMLDWHNKPNESREAIQFYHIRATTGVDQTAYANGGSGSALATSMTSASPSPAPSITIARPDVTSALTLAHLYHSGARGVPQNLTKALFYYEIAAEFGDNWEAAGHAGMCYFWGLGMDHPYRYTALEYFEQGAPLGLEGCRRRFDKSLRLTKQQRWGGGSGSDEDDDALDDEDDPVLNGDTNNREIITCDARSLNGLGLVHLYGVEGEIEPDLVLAEKYFTLAKEMGSIDAHYNLAMMWLGFKTHFKSVDDLSSDGQTSAGDMASPFQQHDKDGGKDSDGDDRRSTYVLHKSQVPLKEVFKGPTQKEYADAMKLLAVAARKEHVLARHRLAMIYSHGVKVRGNDGVIEFDVVKRDCKQARSYYRWIIDRTSLDRSKRLRNAYSHYMNGNMEASLRNYLAAAETGSRTAKLNAAFLLERGTCLGLSKHDCAKASVRLWKAAASFGSSEAYLRVGDVYYYGRMRTDAHGKEGRLGHHRIVGPFGWMQYVIFPEVHLPKFAMSLCNRVFAFLAGVWNKTCPVSSQPTGDESNGSSHHHDIEDADTEEMIESDLAMAAHYYTLAAEKYDSPRANFNLGFMHEWGLGLAQDFPLAKRHYDLAGSRAHEGTSLAINIALFTLSLHQRIVKMEMALIDWLDERLEETIQGSASARKSSYATSDFVDNRRPTEVIASHVFRLDSLLIVLLSYLVFHVDQLRRKKAQDRRLQQH